MSTGHKETVQRQFTKTAEAFSISVTRDTPEVLEEKVSFAKPRAADYALDVACGPGTLVLALAERVRFARGIDLTQEMLRYARENQRQKNILNACFERGEAERLPYASASFDLVTCQCSLHHVPKPQVVVQEMVRVMKPFGRLMIADTLGPESDDKLELYNRIEIIRDPSHSSSLKWTEFRDIFAAQRLDILRETVKRRERSFNRWMLRAGLKPGQERYVEARRLTEESIAGDRAAFAPRPQGEDLVITHHEGMFLLTQRAEGN